MHLHIMLITHITHIQQTSNKQIPQNKLIPSHSPSIHIPLSVLGISKEHLPFRADPKGLG